MSLVCHRSKLSGILERLLITCGEKMLMQTCGLLLLLMVAVVDVAAQATQPADHEHHQSNVSILVCIYCSV
jgi:hypothetical protein